MFSLINSLPLSKQQQHMNGVCVYIVKSKFLCMDSVFSFFVSLRSLLPCTIFCRSRTLIFLQTHHTLISSGSYALLFILQLYLPPPQPISLNLKSELDISLQFFYSALCISLITLHCDLLVGLPFCLSTLTPGMQK